MCSFNNAPCITLTFVFPSVLSCDVWDAVANLLRGHPEVYSGTV